MRPRTPRCRAAARLATGRSGRLGCSACQSCSPLRLGSPGSGAGAARVDAASRRLLVRPLPARRGPARSLRRSLFGDPTSPDGVDVRRVRGSRDFASTPDRMLTATLGCGYEGLRAHTGAAHMRQAQVRTGCDPARTRTVASRHVALLQGPVSLGSCCRHCAQTHRPTHACSWSSCSSGGTSVHALRALARDVHAAVWTARQVVAAPSWREVPVVSTCYGCAYREC